MKKSLKLLLSALALSCSLLGQTTGDPILNGFENAFSLGDGAAATVTTTWDNTGTDVVLTVTTNAFNVSTGTIQQAGTPVVLESRTITGGVGIAAMGDLSVNRTVTFDATELDALTWDAGTLANFSWTYSLSGASDPVINFADGVINATTGVFQVGGTDVVLESLTLTGGNGVATIGDLSANRTINLQLLDAADGTGATSNNSGLEFGDIGSDELALLQGCAANEILKWNDGTSVWACGSDVGSNPFSGLDAPTELTIVAGVITATCPANSFCHFTIDTESDAATDDLPTINCTDGALLLFTAKNDARTVVIQAHPGASFSLDSVNDYAWMHCDAANTVKMASRENGG